MEQIDLLKKVSNTITQEPFELTVDIDPVSWLHEKGQKYLPKYFPKQKVYLIYPAKPGTLLRISELVLSIDKDLFSSGKVGIAENMEAMHKYTKTLCQIVAHAIHNKKERLPASLVETIMEQFSAESLFKVVLVALQSMNVSSFMNSIILVRGLNLLQMNPATQGSTIAPGTQSEDGLKD
jgi:hypothetical protein